jgi:hypothetical protein
MCVYIEVLGETSLGHTPSSPLVRNDDGIIERLMKFLEKEKIEFVPFTGGINGVEGRFARFFYTHDVPKVVKWLQENGAILR